MLTRDQKVTIFQIHKGRYKKLGHFMIVQILKDKLILQKEKSGYCITVMLNDLQMKTYRILLENGNEIKAKPLPDIKQQETQKKQEFLMSKGVGNMIKKITKKEVLEMRGQGKSIEEIVEFFIDGNEKIRSMYTAKAHLFIYGKKPKEESTEETESVKQNENLCAADTDKTEDKQSVIISINTKNVNTTSLKIRALECKATNILFEIAEDEIKIGMISLDGKNDVHIPLSLLDRHIQNLQDIRKLVVEN